MRKFDPSWRALLFPSSATNFFAGGRPAREEALCAELSRIAYIPFENEAGARRVSEILRNAGFARERYISFGGTECFVTRDVEARLTVVSFRGTAGFRDIVTDLMAWRTRWTPGGRVHAGFARALRRIWPTLVRALGDRDGRLIYTGHSLGAALATLAATLVPPDALYTFGSPRVGDARFVELLKDVHCVRTTGCSDLVCQVPPAWLGFEHCGPLNYLDRNGFPVPAPNPDLIRQDQSAARREYWRTLGWRLGNVWTRRLADHAPVNYVSGVVRASPDV